VHSKINCKTYPVSGADNVSELRLNSQVGRLRENRARVDQFVAAVRRLEVPVLACLRSSSNHVSEVGGP
jgi:hypothetical protein